MFLQDDQHALKVHNKIANNLLVCTYFKLVCNLFLLCNRPRCPLPPYCNNILIILVYHDEHKFGRVGLQSNIMVQHMAFFLNSSFDRTGCRQLYSINTFIIKLLR